MNADEQRGTGGWPAVSVVVATRHRPELLLRAVTSILGQSYPGELECLVVFDQSQPEPLPTEILPGRQLRMLSNTRKPGLAGARNAGITVAAGTVIAFCDDDDTWQPDKLTRQVELLNRSAADFVACGVRIRYSDHAVVRMPPAQTGFDQLLSDRVTALHPSTFVIRRSALDDIGLVDEEIPGSYGEDYDLLLRAARRAPVLAVQQPLVDVLWHEQSFFAERWQTISDALRYILAKYPALRADTAGRARIDGQIAFAEAALARRREACRFSWQALRGNPAERRAYLALAVAAGVIPATSIVRAANRRGRGI
jgi:glycosyltransferase involved in cell wall biosynthesis